MYPGLSVVSPRVLEEVPLDGGADDLFVGLHLFLRGRGADKWMGKRVVRHNYLILSPLKYVLKTLEYLSVSANSNRRTFSSTASRSAFFIYSVVACVMPFATFSASLCQDKPVVGTLSCSKYLTRSSPKRVRLYLALPLMVSSLTT